MNIQVEELINQTAPEWESAWNKECETRLAAYQQGEIKALDSAEAMQLLSHKHDLSQNNPLEKTPSFRRRPESR